MVYLFMETNATIKLCSGTPERGWYGCAGNVSTVNVEGIGSRSNGQREHRK